MAQSSHTLIVTKEELKMRDERDLRRKVNQIVFASGVVIYTIGLGFAILYTGLASGAIVLPQNVHPMNSVADMIFSTFLICAPLTTGTIFMFGEWRKKE